MFNVTVDKTNSRPTVQKGRTIGPLLRLQEVLRKGVMRWDAIKAQGKVTITALPTDGQTITIGTKVYTWKTTLTNSDGFILIGTTAAECRTNLMNAINLDGNPGSQYAAITTPHADVEATLISGNDVILTAKVGGTAGNSIALATTMTGGNVVDGATLGTYRAGAAEQDAEGVLSVPFSGAYAYDKGDFDDAVIEYAGRESLWRNGRGNDVDGNDSDLWLNNTDIRAAYPFISQYIAAAGIRKLVTPNYFDRPYTQLRSLGMMTLLKELETISTLPSPFTASTSNTMIRTHVLDTTRFVLIYNQAAGTAGVYAVVGTTASNGSVTWGTPVLLDDTQATNENFPTAQIDTDRIAFGMVHGASNYVHVNVMSISGTTITIGSPVQVAAIVSSRKDLVKVATGKFLIAFHNSTNIQINVITTSGTTCTIGSSTSITGGSQPIFAENGTDKAQINYIVSSKWQSNVVLVVGTTPGMNTAIQVSNSSSYNYHGQKLIKLATDKWLWYNSNGYVGSGVNAFSKNKFGIITVSGVVTTLQPEAARQDYRSNWFDTNQMHFQEVTPGSEYIMYRWESSRFSGVKITISGNNVTMGDVFYRGTGYRTTDGSMPFYRGEIWQNLGQMAMAVTSHGSFVFVTQNDTSGQVAYFADRAFSFDLYLGDDLIGTYSASTPHLTTQVQINLSIDRAIKFGIKVKNKDSVERYLAIDSCYVEIE